MSISTLAQEVKVLDIETRRPINNVTVFNESETFSSFTKDGKVDISLATDNEILIFSPS